MVVVATQSDLAPHAGGVFVPTMGALHAGHAALITHAAAMKRAGFPGPVVVSIFVNPTQFNDPKDLERYPRTLEADLEICKRAGADVVFTPTAEVIYPPGATILTPPLPAAATVPGLEDARRPGHFAGVCQVVLRLFDLVRPRAAVFGEKDYQQLAVLRAMTREARLPITILPGATIREPDGLAMSSRNRFLSPADRTKAAALSRALCEAGAEKSPSSAEVRLARVLQDAAVESEYAVVRDADTLGPVKTGKPARALLAARVGSVRLIDNASWG